MWIQAEKGYNDTLLAGLDERQAVDTGAIANAAYQAGWTDNAQKCSDALAYGEGTNHLFEDVIEKTSEGITWVRHVLTKMAAHLYEGVKIALPPECTDKKTARVAPVAAAPPSEPQQLPVAQPTPPPTPAPVDVGNSEMMHALQSMAWSVGKVGAALLVFVGWGWYCYVKAYEREKNEADRHRSTGYPPPKRYVAEPKPARPARQQPDVVEGEWWPAEPASRHAAPRLSEPTRTYLQPVSRALTHKGDQGVPHSGFRKALDDLRIPVVRDGDVDIALTSEKHAQVQAAIDALRDADPDLFRQLARDRLIDAQSLISWAATQTEPPTLDEDEPGEFMPTMPHIVPPIEIVRDAQFVRTQLEGDAAEEAEFDPGYNDVGCEDEGDMSDSDADQPEDAAASVVPEWDRQPDHLGPMSGEPTLQSGEEGDPEEWDRGALGSRDGSKVNLVRTPDGPFGIPMVYPDDAWEDV